MVAMRRRCPREAAGCLGSEAAAEITCVGTRVTAALRRSPGFPAASVSSRPLYLKAPQGSGDYVCENNRNKGCFQAHVCIYAS